MQRIEIHNNGPVEFFKMDVNKFNILIGEQATGKSTIAKSIYFSRNIKTMITNFLIRVMEDGAYLGETIDMSKQYYKYINRNLKDTFIQFFGFSWQLDPKFKIRYSFSDDIWVESVLSDGEGGKKYITENYSSKLHEEIRKLLQEAISMFEESNRIQLSLELARETKTRNREYILNRINEVFEDDMTTYYIPAGRSMLTLLSASRATMNSLQNIDFVMNRFLELIDGVRSVYQDGVEMAYKYYPRGDRSFDVHEIARQIIEMEKGEYRNGHAGEKLRISCGEDQYEDIGINFASSGQQEIMWLLNFLYVLMLRKEKTFVIIEEPEAHIYPSLQKKIIDFIIQFANVSNGGVMVTTHSPYVLMTMNNAYYSGCIAAGNKDVEVSKIIGPVYRIEKGNLTAIKISNSDVMEEKVIDLIQDENEIRSYLIDDISDEINEAYTSLFSINEE